jgi:hypothetical protein
MRPMLLALVVMLGLPATTVGQNPAGSVPPPRDPLPTWSIAPRQVSRDPLPSFAIAPLIGPRSGGLPLPQIGIPLPPIGLQPESDRRRSRHHRPRTVVVWPQIFYVVPQAAMPMTRTSAPAPATAAREPATGSLVLQVEPGTAQVFIDGYYVGTPDDFSAKRGELVVETGAHRIDINAPGHEPVSFDVKISPNQSIVYRRVLTPIATMPPPAPFIPATRTFYLIPGCYMGTVPPSEAGLPPTCDVSRAVTFTIE